MLCAVTDVSLGGVYLWFSKVRLEVFIPYSLISAGHSLQESWKMERNQGQTSSHCCAELATVSALDLHKGAWPSHSRRELLVMRFVSPLERHLSEFNAGDKVPNQPGPGQHIQLKPEIKSVCGLPLGSSLWPDH